jgi:hypothetical protein
VRRAGGSTPIQAHRAIWRPLQGEMLAWQRTARHC